MSDDAGHHHKPATRRRSGSATNRPYSRYVPSGRQRPGRLTCRFWVFTFCTVLDFYIVKLLRKQCREHITSANHQDVAEAMHKNRVQNAFCFLINNSLYCPHGKRINELKIISFKV